MILQKVLQRARERKVKFNFDEPQLRVNAVKYLSTIITAGVKPDPAKIAAISNMPNPTDKSAVRHLLGMVNFLANHITSVSSITAPLRDLPRARQSIESDQISFVDPPILQYFDPKAKSVIQADASQHGLELLLQKDYPLKFKYHQAELCAN